MGCHSNIEAYRLLDRYNERTGKNIITFNVEATRENRYEKIVIPCGQCIGCRLQRAKDWAVRVYHEALGHKDNCLITLTYNDGDLQGRKSLDMREFQLFMKRLRKKYGKVRFLHCGEYGELCGTCGLNRRKCRAIGTHPFRVDDWTPPSPRVFIWN